MTGQYLVIFVPAVIFSCAGLYIWKKWGKYRKLGKTDWAILILTALGTVFYLLVDGIPRIYSALQAEPYTLIKFDSSWLIALIPIGGGIYLLIRFLRKPHPKSQPIRKKDEAGSQQSPEQIIHRAYPPIKPDPAYDHLEVQLFWESWRYFKLAKWLGAKNGRKRLTGTKIIVNKHTKKAYQVNSYLGSLVLAGKIPYIDRRKTFPAMEVGKWAEKNGYLFYDRYPTEEELQPVIRKANEQAQASGEKKDQPESSGFVVPFSLSGLELTTDKLTYTVGDTIRASVRVLSLTLGATTIRLISPSEKQLAIKRTGFHLSSDLDFDLGVVEPSWEKGVWRITAERGAMVTERTIKIL